MSIRLVVSIAAVLLMPSARAFAEADVCNDVKSLKLTNCRIGKVDSEDADTQFWSLVVNRDVVDKTTMRIADVDNKLGSMGMCNACASNAADTYVKHPESQCGQTVLSALDV